MNDLTAQHKETLRRTGLLYMQPEWLEAVCSDKEMRIFGTGEAIVPAAVGRKMGVLRYALIPWFTQRFRLPDDREAVENLIAAISSEKIAYFLTKAECSAETANRFRQRGFAVEENVTYRMDDLPLLTSREEIYRRFSENKRRQVKRAEGKVSVDEIDAKTFYAFHKLCLAERGKTIRYPGSIVEALERGVCPRNGRFMAARRMADGELLAALFLAWDERYAYYIIPAYRPALERSGAMARLTWEAMDFARKRGLGFDFEGSMVPSIALSYKQFGGLPYTYYSIRKTWRILRLYEKLRR